MRVMSELPANQKGAGDKSPDALREVRRGRDVRTSHLNDTQAVEGIQTPSTECAGCYQPVSDVGVLTRCLLTFTNGAASIVEYCSDCVTIVEAAVSDPGGSYGALALSSEIAKVERPFDGASA